MFAQRTFIIRSSCDTGWPGSLLLLLLRAFERSHVERGEWGYKFLGAFIRWREEWGGKAEKQTSSTEGSGIAIDFAGWKMNNFFFFLSLSLVPPVCTRMCVDIMDKMGGKKRDVKGIGTMGTWRIEAKRGWIRKICGAAKCGWMRERKTCLRPLLRPNQELCSSIVNIFADNRIRSILRA